MVVGYTFTDARALDWDKRLVMTNQYGDTIKPSAQVEILPGINAA
jgi:hypothetical protein